MVKGEAEEVEGFGCGGVGGEEAAEESVEEWGGEVGVRE